LSQPAVNESQLKIVTWNVAGWKSVRSKGFEDYVKKEDPDIICVQETKINNMSQVENSFLSGWERHFYFATKAGYSGTGVFSKIKPIQWIDGIGIKEHDTDGRVITAEFEKFYLVNSYIPNAGKKLCDLDYRMKWDIDFLAFLQSLQKKKPVVWCGDLNVAHEEIDLKNPKTNRKNAGFSNEERANFTTVLKSGFIDTFRHLHPKEVDCYTFWSYMMNARGKGIGWRLDYFVISQDILDKLGVCYRRPTIIGSDHCPLVLHIALR